MRAFIISVLLITIMIACTILNHAYICRILDSMDLLVSELPVFAGNYSISDDLPESVTKPALLWQKNVPILSCTVNMKYIDRVSCAADEIISRYKACDESEYENAKTSLQQALNNLREAEKIGLSGIM